MDNERDFNSPRYFDFLKIKKIMEKTTLFCKNLKSKYPFIPSIIKGMPVRVGDPP
jgi:hypothetical protein